MWGSLLLPKVRAGPCPWIVGSNGSRFSLLDGKPAWGRAQSLPPTLRQGKVTRPLRRGTQEASADPGSAGVGGSEPGGGRKPHPDPCRSTEDVHPWTPWPAWPVAGIRGGQTLTPPPPADSTQAVVGGRSPCVAAPRREGGIQEGSAFFVDCHFPKFFTRSKYVVIRKSTTRQASSSFHRWMDAGCGCNLSVVDNAAVNTG